MHVRKKGRAIWLAARESGSNRDFHFLEHLLSRGGQPQLGFIAREGGSSNVVSRPVDAECIEFRRVDGIAALNERA